MPYKIVKKDGKWAVETVSGKVLGTHATETDAKEQMKAVYANTPNSHLEENDTWKKIKHFVYNHPVYGELTEEEKNTAINSIFDKHQNDNMELLSEYVDMFMLSTAGYGPNSGSRLAYSVAGRGSTGGGSTPGYGGLGDGMLGGKSRQGTRVYGAVPNNLSTGDGVAQIGSKNGDPAIVMVAPKVSNYKPWTVQMTQDGEYRQKDIERNKYQQAKEDLWGGPMGDLARTLEDNGYDIDDLNSMSEEELEDIIIKIAKKEKNENETQELKESIGRTRFLTYSDCYEACNRALTKLGYNPDEMTKEERISISSHAINFFNETDNNMADLDLPEKYTNLLEKWKRYSKIQIAREVLASKHQQKKALEKEPGGKAYIIDRYGIEKMMYKFGYTYDDESKKWIKVSKKKDDNAGGGGGGTDNQDAEKKPELPPIETQRSIDGDSSLPKPAISNDPESTPIRTTGNTTATGDGLGYITVPLSNPQDTEKIKDYQARFILALAHNIKEANKFNLDEEKSLWIPVMSSENVLEQMNNLLYDWYSDKNVWLNQSMTIPEQLYTKNENKMSLTGRSYLAALGNLDYIKTDDVGDPIVGPEQISTAMETTGFSYDDDLGKWEYVAQPKEQLNEARKLTENKKLDLSDVGILNGRMVLKAHQLLNDKQKMEEQDKVVAGVDKTQKQELDLKEDPLASNSYPSTSNMIMDDTSVEDKLSKAGYKLYKIGKNPYWSDKEGQVPKAVKSITGDDLKTFIGRSLIAALNSKNGLEYLSFAGNPSQNEKLRPKKSSATIEDKLNSADIEWRDDRGWGYSGTEDKKQDQREDKIQDEAVKKYFRNVRENIEKYQNADWDILTYKQKKNLQNSIETLAAARFNPDIIESWPVGNDFNSEMIRKKHIANMKHYYKFDPATKSMVKRKTPATIVGGSVNLKVAAKNALNRLKKVAGYTGSGIFDTLSKLASAGLDAAWQSTGRNGSFPSTGIKQAARDVKSNMKQVDNVVDKRPEHL
jgi:hypothetical protein